MNEKDLLIFMTGMALTGTASNLSNTSPAQAATNAIETAKLVVSMMRMQGLLNDYFGKEETQPVVETTKTEVVNA
jgi:hypothetical protein